jgi:hypothetical protein
MNPYKYVRLNLTEKQVRDVVVALRAACAGATLAEDKALIKRLRQLVSTMDRELENQTQQTEDPPGPNGRRCL